MKTLRRLIREESGQSLTEYAILIGSIAFGAVITLLGMWGHVWDVYNYVSTNVNNVPTT